MFFLNTGAQNHILNIQAVELLVSIKEMYPAIEAKMKASEPKKYSTPQWEKEALASLYPLLRNVLDAVGTVIRNDEGCINIPDLS